MVVLVFIAAFAGVGIYVYQITHAAGQTELKSGLGNFCVSTNYSDGAHNGDPVNLARCSGVNGQYWSFTGGQITFHDTHGGTGCAQPENAGARNSAGKWIGWFEGARMVMATCSSAGTQNWSHETWNGIEGPHNSYKTGHTLCLTVPNGDTSGTPQLQLRDCNNTSADQKWTNQAAPPPPSSGGNCAQTKSASDCQSYARSRIVSHYPGWSASQEMPCLVNLWNRESGWYYHAANASGAFGIPQALPGSKMADAPGGPDWYSNPETQINWGLGYIKGRYQTPCGAWLFWEANGWYGETQNVDGTVSHW